MADADVAAADRDPDVPDAEPGRPVPRGDAGYWCRCIPVGDTIRIVFRGSDAGPAEPEVSE